MQVDGQCECGLEGDMAGERRNRREEGRSTRVEGEKIRKKEFRRMWTMWTSDIQP